MNNAMESRSLHSELFSKLELNTGKLGSLGKRKFFFVQVHFIVQSYELGFRTCSLGVEVQSI